MTEDRKYAILFAATLLCARKLMELDLDRPSPAKAAAVGERDQPSGFANLLRGYSRSVVWIRNGRYFDLQDG